MLVLDSLLQWGGVVDELDFAKRLTEWLVNGYRELGDTESFCESNTIVKVRPPMKVVQGYRFKQKCNQ